MNKPPGRLAVMTIASANYLPYVKTLMQSVRGTNPSYRRFLVLVDKKSADLECGDLFEIVEAEALGIDSFMDMTIRYDVMELNTAVKPFAIEWLINNGHASTVIYLDPDICVYRRLTEIEAAIDRGASVVVTPHLTAPLEDGKSPNDYHMLQAGVFNLGFIAVTDVVEAREFVLWWGRRLKEACYADFGSNLFTDQRWIDLAPCFLAHLNVLRSCAYNVAYWNLAQRAVSRKGGAIFLEGEELAFFHFSGLQFDKPTVVSKHQDRFTWNDVRPLHKLFKDYRGRLISNGWEAKASTSYHYSKLDGLEVVPIIRRLYREQYPHPVVNSRIGAPFIIEMCNRPADLFDNEAGLVTQLMHKVFRERPDLQAAFTLNSPTGIEKYADWFEASAEREYGLDSRIARPSRSDQEHAVRTQPPPLVAHPPPNTDKPWLYRRWRKSRKWLLERI